MVTIRSYGVGACVAVLVLSVGACSGRGGKQAAATATRATSSARSALSRGTVFDRVVGGNILIRQVAFDADGGAWFMFGATLKHVDAAGSLATTFLPQEFVISPDNVSPQLAVDPDGTVWVLGKKHLAEVRPGTTAAKLIPFGPLPDNPAAEGYRPPELQSIHSPVALASDGAGHVAFALDATSAVRVYDSEHGTFTDVQLPRATDALSLRYFRNARLAIGLEFYGAGRSNKAVIAAANGSLSPLIGVGDSSLVNPYSDTAVLFGGVYPTILDSDGTAHPVALPAGIQPESQLGGVQVGHNDTLVIPTATNITFLAGASDRVVAGTHPYRTGDAPCGPSSGMGANRLSGVNGTSARQGPIGGCLAPPRVAVANDGAVWVFNALPTRARQGTTHLIIERLDQP